MMATPLLVVAGVGIMVILFALFLLGLSILDVRRYDRDVRESAIRLSKMRIELGLDGPSRKSIRAGSSYRSVRRSATDLHLPPASR